jgi:hypothetical protein
MTWTTLRTNVMLNEVKHLLTKRAEGHLWQAGRF